MLLIGFAFLAGIVTVLSPCILPVLPVVLSGSTGGGKARPWGIITGFIASFTVFTLTLSALTQALGIPADALRLFAAFTIFAFALVTLVPFLKDRFAAFASSVAARRGGGGPQKVGGFWSGFVLGISLGLVWTPCVGPIMASVISLALSGGADASSVVITLAYSAGTAVPLFLIMRGGRGLLNRFPALSRNTDKIQKAFGALMLLTAIALFTGADRTFQTWLLDTFPSYGTGLTAIEDNEAVKRALEAKSGDASAAAPGLDADDFDPDPLTLGSGLWLNSPPLTLTGLRGKVVLVDFWTYSCINCLRTLPYLRAWHERYADKGLVIVGVHSPEFAFERSEGNLRTAVADLGVSWPVVADNDFRIWNAYRNRYWPAKYLYDRDGKLVDTHFGEGAYEETERLIMRLLGESGTPVAPIPSSAPIAADRSPETYVGYGRGERYAGTTPWIRDAGADYQDSPALLARDQWSLGGRWTVTRDSAVAETGSSLQFRFRAAKMYLVIAPVAGSASATVTVDGRPVNGGDVRDGRLVIDGDRMYTLYDESSASEATLRVEFAGKVEVFAFTFG